MENNIVDSWNIAKRIQFDGKFQLIWFANSRAGNIQLAMGEYWSSEPDSNVLECLTLSIQSRLDIDKERQSIERDNQ